MAVSSGFEMLILIDCPHATIGGTTVDVGNVSFQKSCSPPASSSVSVSIKASSGSSIATSGLLAASTSSFGHPSFEELISSSHISSTSPSSTACAVTLTTTII
ncbi:hypothetical protein PENCOP_c001G02094 [Penicillium coprophilum]|uniref:Uncharacterized protein n=1 Tax=Penicillium coprophilum TaxID=36646 RepID=A0A1V6V7Q8_9EURO|nr:hypothetical protein PENCOP_c001G02094 [Penicillium coprophilum]